MNYFISILLLLQLSVTLLPQKSFAQDEGVDSVLTVLNNAQHDTTRLHALNVLVETISEEAVWSKYNNRQLVISAHLLNDKNERIKFLGKKYYAAALNNVGFIYTGKGELLKAEEYYLKSLKVMAELNDKKGLAAATNNMGYIYKSQGNIPKALEYYHKSLKIYEECNELFGISNSFNNIAIILHKQGDLQKALEYNLKSLAISKKIHDKRASGITLNNIGLIFHKLNKFDSARKYLNSGLQMQLETNDKASIANTYLNFGVIDDSEQKYADAIANYLKGLKILIDIDDKQGQSNLYRNLGAVYLKIGDTNKALSNAEKSFTIAKQIGFLEELYDAAEVLSDVYRAQGDYKNSLHYFKYYINLRDSSINERVKKESLQKYYQYNYERKAASDSVRNQEEKKVKDAQISAQQSALKQEQTQRYALYGGLLIVLIFSAFIYNRFKITQKQKQIIEAQKKEVDIQRELADSRRIIAEEQKNIIEEKSKEIIDSITYAKRLQDATLPSLDFIKKHVADSFVMYKPKDIVAGDFYWFEVNEDYIYVAAADCTGHGVPGAMVSVVCINALYRAINEFSLSDTGLILDKVRDLVLETFVKSDTNVKDGMDISLLRLSRKKTGTNLEAQWSGANNPLWIVKRVNKLTVDSSSETQLSTVKPTTIELTEIKPDKQPIGKFEEAKPFAKHTFTVEKGTCFYLFTDGFADQFGGMLGKKFKYRPLKELLLQNQDKSLPQQFVVYTQVFESWKGHLEQVDDVCMIAIKV